MTEIFSFLLKIFLAIYFQTTIKKACIRQSFKNCLCFQQHYYLTKQGQDDPTSNVMKWRHYSSKLMLWWQPRNVRNHCLVLNFTLQWSKKVTEYAFWYRIGGSGCLTPVFSHNDSQGQRFTVLALQVCLHHHPTAVSYTEYPFSFQTLYH